MNLFCEQTLGNDAVFTEFSLWRNLRKNNKQKTTTEVSNLLCVKTSRNDPISNILYVKISGNAAGSNHFFLKTSENVAVSKGLCVNILRNAADSNFPGNAADSNFQGKAAGSNLNEKTRENRCVSNLFYEKMILVKPLQFITFTVKTSGTQVCKRIGETLQFLTFSVSNRRKPLPQFLTFSVRTPQETLHFLTFLVANFR